MNRRCKYLGHVLPDVTAVWDDPICRRCGAAYTYGGESERLGRYAVRTWIVAASLMALSLVFQVIGLVASR